LEEERNAMDVFYFYDRKTCIKEKRDEIGRRTERNYADDLSHIMM
jgi:hypothetical protein